MNWRRLSADSGNWCGPANHRLFRRKRSTCFHWPMPWGPGDSGRPRGNWLRPMRLGPPSRNWMSFSAYSCGIRVRGNSRRRSGRLHCLPPTRWPRRWKSKTLPGIRLEARELHDTENVQAVRIVLEPGEPLKKHITPVDVFSTSCREEGVAEIGQEKQEVGADTLIDSPARIPHCWYNEGDADLALLVVKVPRPKESTKPP